MLSESIHTDIIVPRDNVSIAFIVFIMVVIVIDDWTYDLVIY